MPEYFQEGNVPVSHDRPTTSLQKINDLLLKPTVPGFAISAYDSITLTYWPTTNNLHTAVYKKGATTVATITLLYDDASVDDANLLSATKT